MLADTDSDGGYDGDELERFAADLVAAMGAPAETAAQVAESLVLADTVGHNSHGVRRVPSYAQSARDEREGIYHIDVEATPTVDVEGSNYATVDGQFAFGQVVGRTATDLVTEKAAESGMAAVGIRDATHLGRIGEWAGQAADAGLLFGAFVNGQGGWLVAPAGSAERRYGTNPVAFAVPTFDAFPFPIVLDIATSQVAHGKTMEFAAGERSMPAEWTVTAEGGSISGGDAFAEGEGALLPLGGRAAGYKGFGLAMIAELFAAIVGDGLTVAQSDVIHGNAACFLALDPTLFTTREGVVDRVTALAEYIRETDYSGEALPGHAAYGDRAVLPGEPEFRTAEERREHGVPIPDADVEALCAVAEHYGITDRIPGAFADVRASGD